MIRKLGVSRVKISNEIRIRILCIRSNVDTDKARGMMSKVHYPCYSIYEIAKLFNKEDLYCIDCPNVDSLAIPLVNVEFPLKIVKGSNVNLVKQLGEYNPFLISGSYSKLFDRLFYFDNGWLCLDNIQLCNWKPLFKDDNIQSHIVISNNIISYNYEKCVYILTDGNIRHRPTLIGESMHINLNSSECIKYIRKITKNNYYIEETQYFDRILREWVTSHSSEPLVVLGRKAR